MCAIIGWNGKISASILTQMIKNAAPWGPHATGLAYVEGTGADAKTVIFKKPVRPDDFVDEFRDEVAKAAEATQGIAHVRHRTHGPNTERNAHPFSYEGIHFIHNGIISNYRAFTPDAEVDSECLGPLIQNRNITPARGSCGVAWIENNKVYVYRRNQCLGFIKMKSPVNKKPLTVVVTSSRIAMLKAFEKHWIEQGELEEGVAFHITPSGLSREWDDQDYASPDEEREEIWTGFNVGGKC